MKKRLYYFDNAKFLLILLVVFGHVIRPFIEENALTMNLYKFIYTFHMPAFILISGYFAKSFKSKGYLVKITKKLILPYLIFQGIYSVYYFLIEKNSTISINPLDPQWSLWFLMSLFFWNVVLFFITKFNPKVVIMSAFIVGISVGYIDGINNFLSLSRTFVFFPLFIIGFYLKLEHFNIITKPKIRFFSVLFLAFIFITYYHVDFNYEWLFGSKSYSHFVTPSILSGLFRVMFYSLTIITTLSFLSLVPKNQAFYTEWGTKTFYVYLLHGFIIQFLRNSELSTWLANYQSLIMLATLSFLVTLILSTKMITKITKPLIEINFSDFQYNTKKFTIDR
nr:acyltransferase family protein [Metabacillus litoralis]